MGTIRLALLVLLALASPSGDRESARAFAEATNRSWERIADVRDSDKDPARPVTVAAHKCLADLRAAPEGRVQQELWRLYQVATGARVWAAGEGAAMTAWVQAVSRGETVPTLRRARRALAADLAYNQQRFSQPIDLCAEARAWHARQWRARPPQLERLKHLRDARAKTFPADDKALYRAGQFLSRYGGKAGKHAADLVWNGIGLPDGVDYCDAVIEALDPEDSFCG